MDGGGGGGRMQSSPAPVANKRRTANFREDETTLLIQLWGSPSIQNKLFLTHRKAPVMRLLAANMQQRGFYRTPEEIKTRIRNLKCLYHRIKRSIASGTGIGTVDPDWPHFKAMDEILSNKQYPRKLADCIREEQASGGGGGVTQIKEEVEELDVDVDIDDNDSWATNESMTSEYEDDSKPSPTPSAPSPTPTSPPVCTSTTKPMVTVKKTAQLQSPLASLIPNHAGKAAIQHNVPTMLPTLKWQTPIPNAGQKGVQLPLLILNNLNGSNAVEKKSATESKSIPDTTDPATSELLRSILEVQKRTLSAAQQQLELQKQRIQMDRLIGAALVSIAPILENFTQRSDMAEVSVKKDKSESKATGKRLASDDKKALRDFFAEGMRTYTAFENFIRQSEEKAAEVDRLSDADSQSGSDSLVIDTKRTEAHK